MLLRGIAPLVSFIDSYCSLVPPTSETPWHFVWFVAIITFNMFVPMLLVVRHDISLPLHGTYSLAACGSQAFTDACKGLVSLA